MQWKVRYIDYPKQFESMKDEIMGVVHTVLSGGDLILRQQLRDFESHFARYVGTKYAVGVGNCTDGLLFVLKAHHIGPGDEVITVSHTFVATVEVIHHVGATPVFIDIGDDHNMDVTLIEAAISPRTKAIMPVHLNGRVCRMDTVMRIAKKHNLIVIEDAAQALGATFKGKRAGSFGHGTAFSFYPAKLLGAFGDAGCVVTDDVKVAETIRLLRDHGRGKNNEIELWGFNSRLDNLQAALLDVKLTKLDAWIERRRALARIYEQELSGVSHVRLPPAATDEGDHFDAFQNYEIEAESRDGLREHLRENGIETLISWGGKGVHQFKALGLDQCRLPRTQKLFTKVLLLPMNPELTDDQVRFVAACITDFYNRR